MERSGMSSPTSCVLSTNRNDLKKPIYEFTQHPAIEYALCYAHVPRIHRALNHTDGSALVCALARAALALVWLSEEMYRAKFALASILTDS